MMKRSLAELLIDFPFTFSCQGEMEGVFVTGITADSRTIRPGDLFVAVKGFTFDSHEFITEAIQKGASAVVGSRDLINLPVPYLKVEKSRGSLAYLAAAFYSFPSRDLVMIGVTGTDGKTTTCTLIYNVLKRAGIKVGMISTVNAIIGNRIIDTGFHVTTPDPIDVQSFLKEMVDEGVTHCILETTSHGWSQNRIDSCDFDIGVFTNITHEHLDEHGSFENYREAKSRLLDSLTLAKKNKRQPLKIAVLNKDDHSYSYLKSKSDQLQSINIITYSLLGSGDINATNIKNSPSGQSFLLKSNQGEFQINSNLVGDFNAANCLAAFGVIFSLGIDINCAVNEMCSFPGVPGRMERIFLGQEFAAIVDFAHTPNALKNALETVRQTSAGRVISVFGSAGLRDRQKRRMMAEISTSLADYTIFTAEDPRTEDLEEILGEMSEAAKAKGFSPGSTWTVVSDRGLAIQAAVQMAAPGDVVNVCGKGHEQSMCFGTTEFPWDDRTALKSAISDYLKIPGPEMPKLPTSK